MPRGSMQKFFADRGGPESQHAGTLHWPGTADGFPVRGAAGDLRQQEFEDIPLSLDYKSREFQLWKPDEKDEFDAVMDRIVNGWYMQHKREDYRVTEGRIVWLEWVQIYGEVPDGKTPGATKHGQTLQLQPPAGPPPRQLTGPAPQPPDPIRSMFGQNRSYDPGSHVIAPGSTPLGPPFYQDG